jgi:glycosyltransferase involved in cell wall biosynthesis
MIAAQGDVFEANGRHDGTARPGPPLDLVVVMPVYNEADCIASVIRSWLETLERLDIAARVRVIDDGSTDGTPEVLRGFASDARVDVVRTPNSGHGPTILAGYRSAASEAPWVFQVDSDGELDPADFPPLWRARRQYDGVFGGRTNRAQSLGRRALSAASRTAVRLLFGGGVEDVNVPFRLMRTEVLGELLERIPLSTFAPNVIIAGEFGRRGLRVLNVPVTHRPRRTGTSSVANLRLLRLAARSARQTLHYRLSTR